MHLGPAEIAQLRRLRRAGRNVREIAALTEVPYSTVARHTADAIAPVERECALCKGPMDGRAPQAEFCGRACQAKHWQVFGARRAA